MGRLDLEYKEALLDWSTHERGCACNHPGANPPCGACTHAGNPGHLANEDCWHDKSGLQVLVATAEAAAAFAAQKGFTPVGGHIEPVYAMAWTRDGRYLRYLFDVENEAAMFSATCSGHYFGTYDTIEAAFVAAELANWGQP